MGLTATYKTATEEDWGEDHEDPDWLIKQSIVSQAAWRVLLCVTLKKFTISKIAFYFLQCLQQQQNSEASCCLDML